MWSHFWGNAFRKIMDCTNPLTLQWLACRHSNRVIILLISGAGFPPVSHEHLEVGKDHGSTWFAKLVLQILPSAPSTMGTQGVEAMRQLKLNHTKCLIIFVHPFFLSSLLFTHLLLSRSRDGWLSRSRDGWLSRRCTGGHNCNYSRRQVWRPALPTRNNSPDVSSNNSWEDKDYETLIYIFTWRMKQEKYY